MFPFSQLALYNIMETAPETWEGGVYDEKSDVFSYAIILWRLFGSIIQNKGRVLSQEVINTNNNNNNNGRGKKGRGVRGSAAKPLGRVRGSIFLEMENAKRQSVENAKRYSRFVVNYNTAKKSGAGAAAVEEELKQLEEKKNAEDDDIVDEFKYLKEDGKYLPPPLQREAIRKVLN